MKGDVVGVATERMCPDGCLGFLVRKVGGRLECPTCGYTEDPDPPSESPLRVDVIRFPKRLWRDIRVAAGLPPEPDDPPKE